MMLILVFIMGLALGRFGNSAPKQIKIHINGIRNKDGSLDALAILD